MPIKAIETRYAGHRFRSRLEARWAVVLDHLNVKWLYEHEGFETEHGRYLPDFWLPDYNTFLEIKADEPSVLECNKLESLALDKKAFGNFGLSLDRDPLIHTTCPYWPDRPKWPGLLPSPGAELLPVAHAPGVDIVCPRCEGWHQLYPRNDTTGTSYVHSGEPRVILEDYGHPYVRSRGPITVIPMFTEICQCTWELVLAFHKGDTTMQYVFPKEDNWDPLEWLLSQEESKAAIDAGRTARFEHGESPR